MCSPTWKYCPSIAAQTPHLLPSHGPPAKCQHFSPQHANLKHQQAFGQVDQHACGYVCTADHRSEEENIVLPEEPEREIAGSRGRQWHFMHFSRKMSGPISQNRLGHGWSQACPAGKTVWVSSCWGINQQRYAESAEIPQTHSKCYCSLHPTAVPSVHLDTPQGGSSGCHSLLMSQIDAKQGTLLSILHKPAHDAKHRILLLVRIKPAHELADGLTGCG